MAIKDLLLSSLPEYCETIASGKEVCFRPMIVSEEKALLLAKQSENKNSILKTLLNIMTVCFDNKNLKKESIPDFEHMFLLLRAKSIGEIEGFTITCPITGEKVNIVVNLLKDIKLKKEKTNNKIKLNDNLIVIFKEPTVEMLLKYPNYTSNTTEMYKFIGSCIKQIQNLKEIINCTELTERELQDFVENLTSKQFQQVNEYFDGIPQLEILCSYKTSDNVQRQVKIKGIFDYINFFFEHLNLQLFYRQVFQMKYNHNYNIEEIENMIPWERTVHTEQIRTELNQEKQRLNNKAH